MKDFIQMLPKILLVFVIILICYTFSCSQQVAEGLTEVEANAILDKILKVYNEGNLELVDEIVAPENKLHHSVYPEDIVGVEAFKNYITNTRSSFPDINLTFDETVAKGNNIITRWTFTGTNTGSIGELPPTGKKVSYSGISLSHITNGKFSESWIIFNVLEFYKQLGFTVMPPQEQTEASPTT
ncbi:MAG: ester cyclase [Candidatus Kariarchaeaceae archaeon]|jgi:steroid delta-isomerase-like uncharacterized protein